jgi:hypothetical protein
MLAASRKVIYVLFIMTLGIWTGAAVHDTISSHPGWETDPVRYVRQGAEAPGTINPWPFTTAPLVLTTLGTAMVFATYRSPLRRSVYVILGAIAAILTVTFAYFVPTLVRLSDSASLTDDQIVSMSHLWIRLNVLRVVTLIVLLAGSLIVLIRLAQADRHST